MESKFDFNKEFMKIYSKMNRFSYKFNLSEEERQDLVSEAVLKILESKDKFIIQDDEFKAYKFSSWCIRILQNIFINNYRREVIRRVDSFDKDPLILIGNEPLVESSDENIITTELLEEIHRVKIPEVNRKIFFGYLSGYSYESLAEIYEIPLGTIKSKLHEIRKKLKQVLLNKA